jgi:hypothetical protein
MGPGNVLAWKSCPNILRKYLPVSVNWVSVRKSGGRYCHGGRRIPGSQCSGRSIPGRPAAATYGSGRGWKLSHPYPHATHEHKRGCDQAVPSRGSQHAAICSERLGNTGDIFLAQIKMARLRRPYSTKEVNTDNGAGSTSQTGTSEFKTRRTLSGQRSFPRFFPLSPL